MRRQALDRIGDLHRLINVALGRTIKGSASGVIIAVHIGSHQMTDYVAVISDQPLK